MEELSSSPTPSRADRHRFGMKVQVDLTTGCHEWVGARTPARYGIFSWRGKRYLAHRVAWQWAHGPAGALLVCHTCDNPACVNVDHLFLGTHKENTADAVRKSRMRRSPYAGRRPGAYAERDEEIARLYNENVPMAELVLRFSLSRQSILQRALSAGAAHRPRGRPKRAA